MFFWSLFCFLISSINIIFYEIFFYLIWTSFFFISICLFFSWFILFFNFICCNFFHLIFILDFYKKISINQFIKIIFKPFINYAIVFLRILGFYHDYIIGYFYKLLFISLIYKVFKIIYPLIFNDSNRYFYFLW